MIKIKVLYFQNGYPFHRISPLGRFGLVFEISVYSSEEENAIKSIEPVTTEAAGKTVSPGFPFRCDQCEYESASDKGVRQNIRMKHRISQLDGQFDCEVNSTDSKKNPCPLCPEECGLCESEECEYNPSLSLVTPLGFSQSFPGVFPGFSWGFPGVCPWLS